jgi:hypothetical protein
MIPCSARTEPRPTARHAVGLLLAPMLLAGCGGRLAVAPPEGPVRLRLSFQPGRVDRYRTEVRGVQFGTGPTPAGVQAEAVADVAHRIVSVSDEGGATVEVDFDPVSASVNGQAAPIGTNPEPWRIVVAPEGALLDSTRPIALETPDQAAEVPTVHANPSGAINPFPLLSSEPVVPGMAWSGGGRLPSPFGGGAVPFDVAGRLVGYELVAGAAAAVVESRVAMAVDVTVPADEYLEQTGQPGLDLPPKAALDYDGELRYIQRAWLEPDRGLVLRSEITGSFVTDVVWTGVPDDREGFDRLHVEGQLQANTERTG